MRGSVKKLIQKYAWRTLSKIEKSYIMLMQLKKIVIYVLKLINSIIYKTASTYVIKIPLRLRLNSLAKPISIRECLLSELNSRFFINYHEISSIIECLKELFPNWEKKLLKEANLNLNNRFKVFNLVFVPDHNGTASNVFLPLYAKLLEMNDIRYYAQFNRLQHLYNLSKAYHTTKNEKYENLAIEHIFKWIDANPPFYGLSWNCSLELAIRILSITWTLFLCQRSMALTEKRFCLIMNSLYFQAKYIEKNLQKEEKANNHLIGEAFALVFIGILFPSIRRSKIWLRKGMNILTDQLNNQFCNDGGHREQSFQYHRFITELYTAALILLKKNNIDGDPKFFETIEKMHEFLKEITDPGGLLPEIGDADGGTTFNLCVSNKFSPASKLMCGAMLFGREDFQVFFKESLEEALWLFGIKYTERFDNMKPNCLKRDSAAMVDSGIFIMRNGQSTDQYLLFDCGSQGLGEAGHGHADCLSFVLYALGRTLILDPGTYRYNGAYNWRSFFRGTSAHNTVVVDSLDQAIPLPPPDPFGWVKQVTGKLHTWHTSNLFDYVDGHHDGYERLEEPVTHRRRILFVKREYWIIFDLLTGKGEHNFDCLFHFPPGNVILNPIDKNLCASFGNGANIKLIPSMPNVLNANIIEGSEDPIQGWVSYSYGHKEKAPVLCYTQKRTVPAFFETVLLPFPNEEPKAVLNVLSIRTELDTDLIRACGIKWSGGRQDIIMTSHTNGFKEFADFKTDAQVMFLRTENGRYTKFFLKSGSFLKKCNKNLVQFDQIQDYTESEDLSNDKSLSSNI